MDPDTQRIRHAMAFANAKDSQGWSHMDGPWYSCFSTSNLALPLASVFFLAFGGMVSLCGEVYYGRGSAVVGWGFK